MSGIPRLRPATYEDLVSLPDDVVGQILDGELFATPRPAFDHQRVATVLGSDLTAPFDLGRGGPGGWWFLAEPELHLGEHVVVPDIAGWRRERMPVPPRAPFSTLSPDWVCEVLSPSTAGTDRIRKLRIYAEQGVGHAWLVDPVLETLEVFRQRDNGWFLVLAAGGDEVVRAEPFEAIEIELKDLWIRPG